MSAGLFDYAKKPTTLDGLLWSARAQVAAMEHPDYTPGRDGVILHPAAVVELIERFLTVEARSRMGW